ncbi:MAG: DUF4142 domain-containing protein [Bacteroidia bacterium]
MKNILIGVFVLSLSFANAQTTSGPATKRDTKFVKCAAQGGMMEVKLGKLAQLNGSSTEVKELGKKMEEDHTKANDELTGMAVRKNIPFPGTISEKQQRKLNKLSLLSGKEFDKKYTKCMVKDHKKDLCLFKKERRKGKDSEIQSWAATKVPTLESHLQMSKDACTAVKRK